MFRPHVALAALVLTLSTTAPTIAQTTVGQPAPSFTASDTSGKPVSLSSFKGKYVVLEWTNPHCPFVKKHYDGGNMPATQKAAVAKGVVWLSMVSTSKTHQDYASPTELAAWQKSKGAVPTATLMDADGKVGRLFAARTTPHLYIVNPDGKVIYAGGIDSIPSANAARHQVGHQLRQPVAG